MPLNHTTILDFGVHIYPYWEDINEGILLAIPNQKTGPKLRVLDVGCGRAALGQAILERGHSVWGVECEPSAVEKAAARLERVIAPNLNDRMAIEKELAGQDFDCIVFSDVLEHVYDPLGTLRMYLQFLKPGGSVLISVPNIANWEARLNLFFGRFEYATSGVMDRTHIRFFTRSSARRIVKAAGLAVEQVGGTPYLLRACVPLIKRFLASGHPSGMEPQESRGGIIDSPLYLWYQKLIYPIEYGIT